VDDSELAEYIERVHLRTREAVERLTDEAVGWRPRPGEFTAGELVAHIAASRLMNARSMCGEPLRYPGHDLPAGTTAGELLALVDRTSAEVLERLAGCDLHSEIESRTSETGRMFAWQRLLGGLSEHEVHHRSQLCEYLSGMGIEPPPLYGLHVEDLPR
jgi:uncharacterized damage-inducible protein DinB